MKEPITTQIGGTGIQKYKRVPNTFKSADKGIPVRHSNLSEPSAEIDLGGNYPPGTVNEAGLKSILEDSHFSREFDNGVDLHNMKDDFGSGSKEDLKKDLYAIAVSAAPHSSAYP